jgi:hypothetical protein
VTGSCGRRSPRGQRRLAGRCDGEIEMVVVAAGGVEGGAAMGAAGVGLEVGGNGELGAAGSAEDGLGVPFGFGPGFKGVVGQGGVAVFAGVVDPAAFHFDGDDVERRVVVEASGLRIEADAADFGSGGRHAMREE